VSGRVFPASSDMVEILTDGEDIVMHCLVCRDHPVIGTWTGYALLNNLITAWYVHQEQQRPVTQDTDTADTRERDVLASGERTMEP
jgi:hypothetical protein